MKSTTEMAKLTFPTLGAGILLLGMLVLASWCPETAVAQGLPDLIVESLTHSPASPTTADRITFTAVVKNIGEAVAGPSTLNFRIGGETFGTNFAIPELQPGDAHVVARQEVLAVAQSYQNSVTADAGNAVTESNENNNVATDFYRVFPASVQGRCGQAITQSVTLTSDIVDCTGDGIILAADGITLDGNGHRISGGGAGSGVVLVGRHGVTVTNLTVTGFAAAVEIQGGAGNSLCVNRFGGNGAGVSLVATTGNTVTRNIIAANALGILAGLGRNEIFHNIFINNLTQVEDLGQNTWEDPLHKLGNFWANYFGVDDGSDTRTPGDLVGDTRLPHEGVDNFPLLDPSIPERFGPLLCADWWLYYRGGWSPVDIRVLDPFGREISRSVNQIGENAFYTEDDQAAPGTLLVRVLIHRSCPGTQAEGTYTFQMTGLADLNYTMEHSVSERGELLLQQSIEGALASGETQQIVTRLAEAEIDGEIRVSAQRVVALDIKPGSFPNSINLGSGGTVPVAILSTSTFDATTVDPTTVTLESAPVQVKGKGKGTPMASVEDVNGDGLPDLVVHVSTEALQVSEGDESAVLEGQTFDGTPIMGTDLVRVVR